MGSINISVVDQNEDIICQKICVESMLFYVS